jgi:hypothetical protein
LPGVHAERLPWNKIRSGAALAAGWVTARDGGGDVGGDVSELAVETGAGTVRGAAQAASNSVSMVIRAIKGGRPCLSIFLT